MKELSLNILDIAQNSVTARSTLIRIDLVVGHPTWCLRTAWLV